MLSTREELINALKHYHSSFPIENTFRENFIELLKSDRAFHRDYLPGHLTGSAWIIDETKEFALLTHHVKLNRWLQPGGHADGDENIFRVALREAEEETGITTLTLMSENLFDIDIHTIPQRKDFPEHLHYDVRFLFQASKTEELIITDESNDLAWVKMEDLLSSSDQNDSIARMIRKVRALL
jgi:8-oxo-dGTP pyrophosphatase MutT (NUDIX family)